VRTAGETSGRGPERGGVIRGNQLWTLGAYKPEPVMISLTLSC
jgi:hypothetical protein